MRVYWFTEDKTEALVGDTVEWSYDNDDYNVACEADFYGVSLKVLRDGQVYSGGVTTPRFKLVATSEDGKTSEETVWSFPKSYQAKVKVSDRLRGRLDSLAGEASRRVEKLVKEGEERGFYPVLRNEFNNAKRRLEELKRWMEEMA